MNQRVQASVGAVAIGRNEGERLRRCLESIVGHVGHVVYVDSGSTDDSVSFAKSLGVHVVELDMSTPFTAARARNAGLDRLLEIEEQLQYVHFFDGDCEMMPGWIEAALDTIEQDEEIAVVWGKFRERYPERTLYNRLCDLEWKFNWSFGKVKICGGNALMRVSRVLDVGGFNPALVAGEEPELCLRLRERGWVIYRIDADMVLHDADMTRFSQWWRRSLRGGYADAERDWLYRHNKNQHWRRITRGAWFWGLALPLAAFGGAWPTGGWSLALLAAYPVTGYRAFRHIRGHGATRYESFLYAFFAVLSKFPAVLGQLKFFLMKAMGKKSALIEYK